MSTKTECAGATVAAFALFQQLLALGLNDAVVCPGSRSQALALAAAYFETQGKLRLHVTSDERSAAFYALGCAKETGKPAAVIVTSGSAVGNLMPAVMEAHAARVPLLLLTADRPQSKHGKRSNQTIQQTGIFTPFLRAEKHLEVCSKVVPGSAPAAALRTDIYDLAHQLWQASCGSFGGAAAGPAQLNLGLTEPLATALNSEICVALAGETQLGATGQVNELQSGKALKTHYAQTQQLKIYALDSRKRTVILAGAGADAAAEALAHQAQVPLLAEVVSGARYGREAIAAYQKLLADPETVAQIERVIVIGHPTLTREAAALVTQPHIEVVVLDQHTGETFGGFAPVTEIMLAADYDKQAQREWLGLWICASRQLLAAVSARHEPEVALARASGYRELNTYVRQEVAAQREKITREMLAEAVWNACWPHDRLVVAASRLVRVLDRVAAPRPVRIYANRGVAGIDGTVATALGVAVTAQDSEIPAAAAGVTRVLIGDLALLHDAGSLALTPGEPKPRVQLFVGNDNGGTIFESLEVRQVASSADFRRVVTAPHRVQLEQLAKAYGWEYRLLATRGELVEFLQQPVAGPQLIEVRFDV